MKKYRITQTLPDGKVITTEVNDDNIKSSITISIWAFVCKDSFRSLTYVSGAGEDIMTYKVERIDI